jgi:hypothetical protein
MFGVCLAVALTAVLGAQDKMSGAKMDKMGRMDKMAAEKTYSGCVEKSASGGYTLTHVTEPAAKMAAKKGDAMMKDDMAKDGMMKDGMAKESMAPSSLELSGGDLSHHVGHKVTVTGTAGEEMHGMTGFTVKSLKMTGKSCA